MRLEEIRSAVQAGAVMLTPNVRSARQWRRRIAEGAQAVPSSSVLPWRAWTAALWQEVLLRGVDDRVALNDVQCARVWEDVLREAHPTTLRPMRSLVQLCVQAQTLVHGYLAADRFLSSGRATDSVATDAEQFRDWFARFDEICRMERLLPLAALESALSHAAVMEGLSDQIDRKFLVLGFDRLLPVQEALLAAMTRSGAVVLRAEGTVSALGESLGRAETAPKLLRYETAEDESASLAASLREELETSATPSVAVVVPDLDQSRASLERALRQTVAPEMRDVEAVQHSAPWEFSAGVALSSLPMVADALRLLRWAVSPLPVQELSPLLRSAYLAFALSPDRAAELDANLLRRDVRLRPDWSVESLARRCRDTEPRLREQLLTWARIAHEGTGGEKSHGRWGEVVRSLLREIGWPGTRERTSVEFQSVDRWEELLDSLATLDVFDQPVSFREFLEALEHWAEQTLFAPENTGAPIQIMTVQESAGSTFDRLWFPHADEGRVNARRSSNPLLPWSLQQAMGMPGTDAQSDREQALAMVSRVAGSATEVSFSYAGSNAEGAVRPSPVVEALPGLVRESVALPPEIAEDLVLEPYEVELPVPLERVGAVSGGVGVLQSQAACEFRAFAEKRLFSTEIEDPDLGLDFRERGSLLHSVLESFWNEVGSQERLLKLRAEGALEGVLLHQIDAKLAPGRPEDAWSGAYRKVQRERLRRLLWKWLDFEATRPAFKVLSSEKKVPDVSIGGLQFDLRVDRIDEVMVDGAPGRVLIDYKTGKKDDKSWLGDRPDEPQLPLYAVAAGIEGVEAVAFGVVKPGKDMGVRSLPARSPLLHAKRSEDAGEAFEEQRAAWHATLERLAEDFAAGAAKVGPKEYPTTCMYCAQRMLCRLNPEVLDVLAEEDEAEVFD